MKKSAYFIIFSSIACITACLGEFVFMFIFGAFYPGYDHLKNTMSSLGASKSPVSAEMSAWWVVMGVLIIFFGIGFQKAFSENGRKGRFASWLIILYGLGEGIGSGLFKADRIPDGMTFSGFFHDMVGGIGVTAILIFPLIMQKMISNKENLYFSRLSIIVFVCGIVSILLFLFRFSPDENDFLSIYKGLWQRLFMLNTYIYLTTIAILMIKRQMQNTNDSNITPSK
jgi:hypothetical membrane protein